MPSFGANTPMNLVAAYAQAVAETLGGAILFEALTGVPTDFGTNVFPFDFYDLSMPFGTPEKLLLEWINMEVSARIGGGEFTGPVCADIHTNAPYCGIQACIEKSILASAAVMSGANIFYCSGTLGMDELFSPVQLLLDLEMLDHLNKIVNGMPNDAYNGDLIEEIRAGLDNGYFMSERTADNMLGYIWHSKLFTRKSFVANLKQPGLTEVEKAKEKVKEIMRMDPAWRIDPDLEKEAERIFKTAAKSIEN